MEAYTFSEGTLTRGMQVITDTHLKNFTLCLGNSERLGNVAKVALFKNNPPFVEKKEKGKGLIFDVHPVLTTVNGNVYQTLARPNEYVDSIVLRLNTRGEYNDQKPGYVYVREGSPTLLARAQGAICDGGYISTYDDIIYIVRVNDRLEAGMQGGETFEIVHNPGKGLEVKQI